MAEILTGLLNDSAVIRVLDAIEAGANPAYLVGGAVRNALLGERVDDIDIATATHPEDVQTLAAKAGLRSVPTGISHGTVTVISEGRGFEVTTFRRDVITDGRHAVVSFSESLTDDAQRRDFTMNALYADRAGTIIDPVNGLADLAVRNLRFVGDPETRIREDYLRILRFFRFLAWYGKQYDPKALEACAALRYGLENIAAERIGAELKKLLAAPAPSLAVDLIDKSGILRQLFVGADAAGLQHLTAVERAEGVSPAWIRRLTALTVNPEVVDALRLPRQEARTYLTLCEALRAKWSLDEAGFRLESSAAVDFALLTASRGGTLPVNWRQRIARAGLARLPISAADLMPRLDGAALGAGLKAAESEWLRHEFTLTPEQLVEIAFKQGSQR